MDHDNDDVYKRISFISRMRRAFEFSTGISGEDWIKEKTFWEEDLLRAIYNLAAHDDPKDWNFFTKKWGRVCVTKMGGRHSILPPPDDLTTEVQAAGRGGVGKIAKRYGLTQPAIRAGMKKKKAKETIF